MKRFSLGAIVLAVVLALRGAAAGVCTGATYCSSDSDCDQAATEYCDLSTQTCQYVSCTTNSDCVGHPCSSQGDCLCDSGTSTCRWVYWMGFAPAAEPAGYEPQAEPSPAPDCTCPAGQGVNDWSNGDPRGSCLDCPVGRFSAGGVRPPCANCPSGKSAAAKSAACVAATDAQLNLVSSSLSAVCATFASTAAKECAAGLKIIVNGGEVSFSSTISNPRCVNTMIGSGTVVSDGRAQGTLYARRLPSPAPEPDYSYGYAPQAEPSPAPTPAPAINYSPAPTNEESRGDGVAISWTAEVASSSQLTVSINLPSPWLASALTCEASYTIARGEVTFAKAIQLSSAAPVSAGVFVLAFATAAAILL